MTNIPEGEIFRRIFDESKNAIKTITDLEVADVEIGAVEIKDGDTDNRAKVEAGSLYVLNRNQVIGKITAFISSSQVLTLYNPSVSYSYDSNGNLTTIQMTDGTTTIKRTYSYDSNGNLTSISAWQVV